MSRIQPASLHHGKATSARSTGAATTAKARLAFVARSTRSASITSPWCAETARSADDQDDQEGDVAGEDWPGRRQRRADRLCDAEHHAADQRTPHIAEPADDH